MQVFCVLPELWVEKQTAVELPNIYPLGEKL